MLALSEVGRRAGLARVARDPEGMAKGAGPIEGAVLGLLGLLLAFTFSGAASRFEARRTTIGEEANAIGTAYLRIDMLPNDAQPEIRQLFRQYLGARMAAYGNVADSAATNAATAESNALQGKIWKASVAATQRPGLPVTPAMLMLPALNDMIDITTTRAVANRNHPPRVVFQLLVGFNLVCALLTGYSMAASQTRNWFYTLLVTLMLSLTLYVILDLEYPRLGLIRIDDADHTMVDLLNSMR
jgi:hypothetical protein